MSRPDDTLRHQILAGSCAGGAALCLALLALELFGSTLPPEQGASIMLPGSLFAPPGAYEVVPSSTSGLMILAAPATALWAFSIHVRCSDAQIRHHLKGVAALIGLWMLDVLVKYRYPIHSPVIVAFLWYLFYVPMTLIPMLCLLCALRAAALDGRPWARILHHALGATSLAIIALVLTNTYHLQVFAFDITQPDWQDTYVYRWGYWLAVAIYLAEYLAFFGFLLASARRQLRSVIGLLVMAAVPFAAYALLYALRHQLAARTNFSLNYCLVVMALLELALDFGLLPSYAWYGEAFARLPLDLKILEQDGAVAFETDVAEPAPQAALDLMRRMPAPGHAQVIRFRTSALPHTLFKAMGVRGGVALLAEDVALLDEQHRVLASRNERLQRSNRVLKHESSVRHELWRLESEGRLCRSIEASIADKVGRMQALLDALPQGTSAQDRACRRDMLMEVKLLVAYCKRKGALTLSEKSDPAFGRDRLQLVFNETASDLRSIGVDCAAMVDVRCALAASTVSVLYDCLYDVASVALFATDPILMLYVSGDEEGIEMRVALEAAKPLPQRVETAITGMRESLAAQGGTLSLVAAPTSFHVAMRMRAKDAGQPEGGHR